VDPILNLLMLSPLKAMTTHGLTFGFYCLGAAASTPLILLAAWASYRWVETPFITMCKALGSAKATPAPTVELPAS